MALFLSRVVALAMLMQPFFTSRANGLASMRVPPRAQAQAQVVDEEYGLPTRPAVAAGVAALLGGGGAKMGSRRGVGAGVDLMNTSMDWPYSTSADSIALDTNGTLDWLTDRLEDNGDGDTSPEALLRGEEDGSVESMISPVFYTLVLCNNMKPNGTLVSGYVGCMSKSRGCFMASPIQSPSCSLGLMSVNKLMEEHSDSMSINFTHLNSSRWQAEWGELVPDEQTVATARLPRTRPSKFVYVAVLDDSRHITFYDGCRAGRKALGLEVGMDGEGALSFACSDESLDAWRSAAAGNWCVGAFPLTMWLLASCIAVLRPLW